MRTALYARYSSERQNARSIADQLEVCRRRAALRGWTVVAEFSDAAISGAAMANRPGLQALLAAAGAGAFELVLVEDEDRLARSQEHLAHIQTRLEYLGIPIATLDTDRVDDLRVAFKGLIGSQYLKALGQKTARGMRSNAEKGLATGSRLFGYASSPGGAVRIQPAQAEVIRRIFRDYAAGLTALDIAGALNREGVPGPRGGRWNRSSIVGSRSRANGILHSELYAGVKVYGRVQMRKDPQTGKRLPRVRPREEWLRVPVPELRIVPEALWARVQARLDLAAAAPPWTLSHGRRKGLFSGLVRCGICGAGYVTHGAGHLRCAARLERGPQACRNRRAFPRAELERRVIAGLRARLLRPEAVLAYVRAYHAAWRRQRAQEAAERAPLETRLRELARSAGRLVDAIAAGADTPAMRERLMAEDAERRRLEAELARRAPEAPPIELHPRAAELYARRIGELQARLAEAARPGAPQIELALRDAVRGLVDRIEVTPLSDQRLAPVRIELFGRLRAFLQPMPAEPGELWGVLVAGGDNSPTPTPEPTVKIAV